VQSQFERKFSWILLAMLEETKHKKVVKQAL